MVATKIFCHHRQGQPHCTIDSLRFTDWPSPQESIPDKLTHFSPLAIGNWPLSTNSTMSIQVNKIREYQGHIQPVYSLSPALQADHFLSCGSEGIVAEWSRETGEAKALVQATTPIFSMRLFPERKMLMLGMESGEIVFADLESNQPLRRVQLHKSAVFDIIPLPGGENAVVCSMDGCLSIWNLDRMDHLHLQRISQQSVRTMALSPDGKALLTGASDNMIRVFDLGLDLQRQWLAHEKSVFRIAFSPNGKILASTGRDAHLTTWDVTNDYKKLHSAPAHMYTVNDLVFQPEGNLLFSGSMDKSIRMWDPETLELKKVVNFEKNACHWNGVNRLLWHEGRLLSCSDDRRVMEWGVVSGQ
jgi:WD40 repeat protein